MMDTDSVEFLTIAGEDCIATRVMAKTYEYCRKDLQYYVETENRLIKISGLDMEKLIELFAAGYILVAPKKIPLSELRPIR